MLADKLLLHLESNERKSKNEKRMSCDGIKLRFAQIVGENNGEGECLFGGNRKGVEANEEHIHMTKSSESERLFMQEKEIIIYFVMLLRISFFIENNVGKRQKKQVRVSFHRKRE